MALQPTRKKKRNWLGKIFCVDYAIESFSSNSLDRWKRWKSQIKKTRKLRLENRELRTFFSDRKEKVSATPDFTHKCVRWRKTANEGEKVQGRMHARTHARTLRQQEKTALKLFIFLSNFLFCVYSVHIRLHQRKGKTSLMWKDFWLLKRS